MTDSTDERPVAGVVDGMRALEGEGFMVRRPFPNYQLDHFGPFLLLDEMGPSDNAPGEAKGAPDHPHRGFETVTYVLDGEIRHKDSIGGGGLITPGDVQWMTAGAGIVHSEMPSDVIMNEGGRVHGFQLWVNLPTKAKWHRPRYQDLVADHLPKVELDGGRAVIIAGRAYDTVGTANTFLPITYLHLSLEPGASTSIDVETDELAFVYAFRGNGGVGKTREPIVTGQMALFDVGGGRIPVAAGERGLEAIVGAARPLEEPVVRYGPFVMNTRAEILQAFEDYQAGRLGRIEPERA